MRQRAPDTLSDGFALSSVSICIIPAVQDGLDSTIAPQYSRRSRESVQPIRHAWPASDVHWHWDVETGRSRIFLLQHHRRLRLEALGPTWRSTFSFHPLFLNMDSHSTAHSLHFLHRHLQANLGIQHHPSIISFLPPAADLFQNYITERRLYIPFLFVS